MDGFDSSTKRVRDRFWKTIESRFEVAIFEVMIKWKLLSVNDCESRSPTVAMMEILNSF
jgi:hypothetical protein